MCLITCTVAKIWHQLGKLLCTIGPGTDPAQSPGFRWCKVGTDARCMRSFCNTVGSSPGHGQPCNFGTEAKSSLMLPGGGKGPAYTQLGDVVHGPTEVFFSLQASWHAPQEGHFCSFAPAMLVALYEYKQSQKHAGGLYVHICCCCCICLSTATATPASHLPCDAAQP